jgi:MoaA/NifB/PqqE/SkfB family radical SAM enzyme/predicted hotdog family 3-hydroxylacyl-ACP dehydratase
LQERNVRGDCSIRINGLGFSREEIAACAERTGLLSLEIDLACPGDCQCAACQSSPQAARPTLSLPEIFGLLDQAAALGARRCILVDSEPTSYADLLQLIDHIHAAGMQVELFTNGAALSDATARFLRQRGVAVVLKLDSLNRDIANRLAGNDHAYDTAHAALANLKRAGYGDSIAPRLAVRTDICDENLGEIPAIWRWARSQKMEPYVQIITPRSRADEKPRFIAPERAKLLFEELGRIDHDEFARDWETSPSLIGRSCKRHLFACHVTPCGTIFACVGVTIPLGDIRVEPLAEILNLSEVLENIRAFEQKVKEPCRTCCKTVDCYGCRGAAYQLTGDYLAGDQLCWKAKGVEIPSLPIGVQGIIPHGPSMRMIDRLVQIGERYARTEFVVRQDSVLVDASGRLDELAYIEMIAQSFAACHGFHLTGEVGKVHRGLLIGIKDLIVSGEAFVGDRLTVIVRKITRFGDFGVVEGDVLHQNGKLMATGQVKIWRPSNEFLEAMIP